MKCSNRSMSSTSNRATQPRTQRSLLTSMSSLVLTCEFNRANNKQSLERRIHFTILIIHSSSSFSFCVRYVERGEWGKCLSAAEKQGGQVLSKYVALYAASQIQDGALYYFAFYLFLYLFFFLFFFFGFGWFFFFGLVSPFFFFFLFSLAFLGQPQNALRVFVKYGAPAMAQNFNIYRFRLNFFFFGLFLIFFAPCSSTSLPPVIFSHPFIFFFGGVPKKQTSCPRHVCSVQCAQVQRVGGIA